MMRNPWATPAFCRDCEDIGQVRAGKGGCAPCPSCGIFSEEELDSKRRKFYAKTLPFVELRREELNPEEETIVAGWIKEGHAEISCLSWIEGRRYNPRDDKTFMRQMDGELEIWRAKLRTSCQERGGFWASALEGDDGVPR